MGYFYIYNFKIPIFVPAKAGIQSGKKNLDPRFRGDEGKNFVFKFNNVVYVVEWYYGFA